MPIDTPVLAAIRATAGIPVDTVLAETAAALRSLGMNVRGILQEEYGGSDDMKPVTRLRDVADGTLIQISQDLGRNARGCRLDPGALAEAARRLENIVAGGADLLILNRFGRSEAEGTGLRPIIEGAILAGIPVLIAVRDEYAAAWDAFHAGMAVWLPADTKMVLDWCCTSLAQPPADSSPVESGLAIR
ncbi:hypothetical protein HYPDE_25428 [Hyphomicrobium denitrificans 1NES1]|uniref:Molybdenum ABC transporter ATP-binding protein n=1 Tax=Hyphomicrobium denitrificans 1NES1 TaxID=670307 RepID=N0B9K1_9HYPH|nr:DUF2478 domain-containing protein [Hyphomicrobium denitrificans]AGK56770.1 hypothetical protein HYPDE_25428 [Hyphomicrobium denitrificans 1NES1]